MIIMPPMPRMLSMLVIGGEGGEGKSCCNCYEVLESRLGIKKARAQRMYEHSSSTILQSDELARRKFDGGKSR